MAQQRLPGLVALSPTCARALGGPRGAAAVACGYDVWSGSQPLRAGDRDRQTAPPVCHWTARRLLAPGDAGVRV